MHEVICPACAHQDLVSDVIYGVENLAAFLFWIAGFFGNTIVWRGRRYRLFSDGRFELLPEPRL